MRLSTIQWVLAAASSTASAAAATAKVLVFDSASSPPSQDETVDSDTARLILAQRIELGQYHSVADASEDSIRRINTYGARQQSLFGQDKHAEPVSRLLVMVEGVDYEADSDLKNSISSNFRSFSISPAPHPADSAELFKAFAAEGSATYSAKAGEYVHHNIPTGHEVVDSHHVLLRYTAPPQGDDHSTFIQLLGQDIEAWLSQAQDRPSSLTIVFTPPASSSTKPSKAPFGLTKRDSKAQRQPSEKPLLTAHKTTTSDVYNPPDSVSANNATKVLRGAIPTCFPNLEGCQRTTQNCTGHGSCILKWSTDTTNEGGSVSKQDCYGCACTKPEVRHNKDGTKKTTKFGGAACHKKDIVFPFWLLAGTTVGLIGILSFGLGMLYEMGGQELPSVIGAGVSGPKAGGGR